MTKQMYNQKTPSKPPKQNQTLKINTVQDKMGGGRLWTKNK